MNDEFLQKRIAETEHEIFPLDRLLSLESIYLIFQQEYAKSEDRNLFFKDPKYQRLREGYFSMFVAISLQDTLASRKRHYLIFPSDPSNDVYIGYRSNDEKEPIPKLTTYEFDIKEYTNWSPNFEEFAKKSIIPKIDIYNIAIPTYRKMDGQDLQLLVDYLKANDLTRRIWILGLPSDAVEDTDISDVTIIDKDGIVYHKTINLSEWIDKTETPMIFQDVIRFK
ncbi:MAG: hypothetical protein KBD26_03090 [Candidatus Pacebacteria bacterium]|nr:hypothetical protein [Candidatus Paceibacterota bacterium]MBP9772792.1 hypothetical protein [Candidatus Paceibacterota bacterium]